MAVTLTGANGLFTRLGKLAKVLWRFHTYQAGNLTSDVAAAQAELSTLYGVAGPLAPALTAAQGAPGIAGTLRTAAQQTVLTMVNADTPQPDQTSLSLALAELRRQMIVAAASVPACTLTVTAAAVSGNTGNGAVVTVTKRGDGLTQDNLFAEVGALTCTGDSQSGTATAGAEPWVYRGDYAATDVLAYAWPGASGATISLTTIDSQTTSPNLVTGGGFDTYTTANVPDGWSIVTGTAGTNIFSESTIKHRGAASLKFLGDGATLQTIAQTITTLVKPNTTYALNLYVRQAGAPAAGVLSVRLVDATPAVINDDQAVANALAVTCSTLTTTFASFTAVFRTPKVLPSAVALRLQFTTALTAAASVYVDSLALAPMTFLYPGGPALAVFAGATPFVVGDGFLVTATNDRAGATYGATWNTVFDRFFGARQLGFLLPTSGAPTIADTLITA